MSVFTSQFGLWVQKMGIKKTGKLIHPNQLLLDFWEYKFPSSQSYGKYLATESLTYPQLLQLAKQAGKQDQGVCLSLPSKAEIT